MDIGENIKLGETSTSKALFSGYKILALFIIGVNALSTVVKLISVVPECIKSLFLYLHFKLISELLGKFIIILILPFFLYFYFYLFLFFIFYFFININTNKKFLKIRGKYIDIPEDLRLSIAELTALCDNRKIIEIEEKIKEII